MNISSHFSYEEAIQSASGERAGINNTPSNEEEENIKFTANLMENVRSILNNKVILVSSWYRSPELNKLVGGSIASQHMDGLAVDFICPDFGTPLECCQELEKKKVMLGYDQLIYEYSWVHISFARENARGQELSKNGKGFVHGLTELT
jgi:hypothetical protein